MLHIGNFDCRPTCFIKSNKMKNLIIVLSVFLTAITVVSAQSTTKKEEPKTIYVCPSHPDKVNPNSGKCPACGMEMKKVTEKTNTNALKGSQPMTKTVVRYVCPMDNTTADKPGKCSKCAMTMVKTTEKVDTHPLKGSQPRSKMVTKYVCPKDSTVSKTAGMCSKCGTGMMKITETVDAHPQKGSQPKTKTVTKYVCPMDGSSSDTMGKCPKCGMEMTKVSSDKKEENHKH